MALTDYIPNVFGTPPVGVDGLIGSDQTQALSGRANVQGLLGAALTLAAGMSRHGAPRSAAENVLNAWNAGQMSAMQPYQDAIQNTMLQQKAQAQQAQIMKDAMQAQREAQTIDINNRKELAARAAIEKAQRGEKLIDADYAALDMAQFVRQKLAPEQNPAAIKEYEYAVKQGYKGNFQQFQLEQKRAGAASTTVNVGGKEFDKEIGKQAATVVGNTFNSAIGAQNTLATVNRILPLVSDGVYSGAFSGSRQFIDRLSSGLNIASNNTQEKLNRTAEAMQGLASLELDAAQAMKGQGQVSDAERALIKRAAGGDFSSMTQNEVVTLLNALKKTANYKIQAHQKSLNFLRNNPETSQFADLYTIESQEPQSQPQHPMNFQDAARKELERRKAQGGNK